MAVVALYAVHGSMDVDNPIKLPGEKELYTVAYLPEGWKFFTRNAREDLSLLYRRDEAGHWVRADSGANASSSHLFGLKRNGRNEHIESGIILTLIPQKAYAECDGDVGACLEGKEPSLQVSSYATQPKFCGTLAVVKTPRVPWAWATSPKPPTMTSKYVVVDVKC